MQAVSKTKSKKITTGDVLRTYNRLLRGFRWPTVLCVVIVVISSALNIAIPWFYKAIFDVLSSSTPSPAAGAKALHVVFWLAVFHGIGFVVWRASGFLTAWCSPRTAQRLHEQAFSYLIRHSYRFYTNQFSGSLVRMLNRFVDAFGQMHEILQWEFVPLALTLLGAIVSVSTRSPLVGAVMLAWVIAYMFVNVRLALWKLKYDEQRSEADSDMSGTLSDIVSNNLNVKSFAAYGAEEKRYFGTVANFIRLWRLTWNISEVLMSIQVFFFLVLELAIVYLAVRAWAEGTLTIGDFALIQGFIFQLIGKLWEFGRHVRRLFELMAEAKEMTEIFETPHEVVDVKSAKVLAVETGGIEFKKVSFGYRENRGVLNQFDLAIAPGEKVALVGPSGAGKTTVTKLIMRFFDVKEGTILIDGQDIAKVTQDSLWQSVGFVPQDPALFHRSLMENIRYGKPDATDEEVFEAAKKARCHDFISELANGYETLVGERGVKLSGGERQRVAIARAILKNAPILVLDEATSSLDSESEQMIQDSLAELMKGKTVIVIAHRLSTIMKMDRILVMENGKVAEQGTHKELLEEVGTYQRLWHIQAGGFAPKS